MSYFKRGKSSSGAEMHYSVGAIIKRGGKYLLIDRNVPPYGFAGVAGHIDSGETPEQALIREVEEESGLTVISLRKIHEEEAKNNVCSKGTKTHYWYLFDCAVSGTLNRNLRETKSIGWYSQEEIKKLKLEPIWKYWFEKLKII